MSEDKLDRLTEQGEVSTMAIHRLVRGRKIYAANRHCVFCGTRLATDQPDPYCSPCWYSHEKECQQIDKLMHMPPDVLRAIAKEIAQAARFGAPLYQARNAAVLERKA